MPCPPKGPRRTIPTQPPRNGFTLPGWDGPIPKDLKDPHLPLPEDVYGTVANERLRNLPGNTPREPTGLPRKAENIHNTSTIHPPQPWFLNWTHHKNQGPSLDGAKNPTDKQLFGYKPGSSASLASCDTHLPGLSILIHDRTSSAIDTDYPT